jgi:hypothetical protein
MVVYVIAPMREKVVRSRDTKVTVQKCVPPLPEQILLEAFNYCK